MPSVRQEKFAAAMQEWREAVEIASEMANDPYKAPEQVIATIKPVLDAAWELQLRYLILLN